MTLDRNVLSHCNSCIIWNHTRAPGRYVPAPGLALAAFPSPLVTEPIHVPVPLDDFVAIGVRISSLPRASIRRESTNSIERKSIRGRANFRFSGYTTPPRSIQARGISVYQISTSTFSILKTSNRAGAGGSDSGPFDALFVCIGRREGLNNANNEWCIIGTCFCGENQVNT